MGLLRPRSPLARPSDPGGAWHRQLGGNRQRAGADRDARTGPPRGRTHTHTQTSHCAGDGTEALSVSALRVRLGQDRLRGGRASGAERRREQHPRPRTRLCQQQMWNFLTRSTRLQQTDRAGMMNFLAPEEVPFSTQVAPHERCLASCIHLRAGARAIQRRRAHPVVLTSGWRSGRQPRAAVGGGMHTPRVEFFVQPLCCCGLLGDLSRKTWTIATVGAARSCIPLCL